LNELGDTQDQRLAESWRYHLHADRQAIAREACRHASGGQADKRD
jgi:RNA binding exosome subunit